MKTIQNSEIYENKEYHTIESFTYSVKVAAKDKKLTLVIGDPAECIYDDDWDRIAASYGCDADNFWFEQGFDGVVTDDNDEIVGIMQCGEDYGYWTIASFSKTDYRCDTAHFGVFDAQYCYSIEELKEDKHVRVLELDDSDEYEIELHYFDGTFTIKVNNRIDEKIYTQERLTIDDIKY